MTEAKISRWKKEGQREKQQEILRLLKDNKELRNKDLKMMMVEKGFKMTDPTLSVSIKDLEKVDEIEHFSKTGSEGDRRERWYRIKPENLKKVEASLYGYEAVEFIESFSEGSSSPIYSYEESKDGKKAIAAFSSSPLREDERKNAQSKVDGIVSSFLKMIETLLEPTFSKQAQTHPGKDRKIAVVIMVRKGIKKEGSEP